MSVSHRTVFQHIALVVLLVGGIVFTSLPRSAHASTIVQTDISGNVIGLDTDNVLVAGGTLNLYVKVKNDTGASQVIAISETGGTLCSGVSRVIVQPAVTVANNASQVFAIQIVANTTVTTATCNTIIIEEDSTNATTALAFYIGATPSPTSTPSQPSATPAGDGTRTTTTTASPPPTSGPTTTRRTP